MSDNEFKSLPSYINPQQARSFNPNMNNEQSGLMANAIYSAGSIGPGLGLSNRTDSDNKSIGSTPSKISKFTYSGL